jgi:hypothetical protein
VKFSVKNQIKVKGNMSKVGSKSKAVVVTTEHRGVFFGYAEGPAQAGKITLTDAQMCVYWSPETRGVLGLGAGGPQQGSKVTAAVPSIDLEKVTAVMDCTPEAEDAWKKQPWN